MFHFPGCPPMRLWIHLMVTGHCPGRVPPFGYPWIDAHLRLPMAFRSLSRPSSAISALASTLRSSSLDLAFDRFPVPKTIETGPRSPDLSSSFLPCAVFKVRAGGARSHLLPPSLARRVGHRTASRRPRRSANEFESSLSRTLKTIQRSEYSVRY